MISEDKVQRLIACLTTMKELLGQLQQSLECFSSVIDEEFSAVEGANLPSLEGLVKQKVIAGNKVEQITRLFTDQAEYLGNDFQSLRNGDFSSRFQLSIFMSSLLQLQEELEKDMSQTAFEITKHLLSGLKQKSDEIGEMMNSLAPKIKANAYLVRKLLFHHRETYRFWQSFAQDTQSVYSPSGRSQSQSSSSMFRVKT